MRMMERKRIFSKEAASRYFQGRKPIKVIKNDSGTFWNANDGKETYSKDIVALLDYLKIYYELKDETQSKPKTK